ncbi:MAG: WG repeat-containing protein [Bacillus subtilis]|nr:WG repeat-containing protein [Bacillus subtilis]
MALVRVGNLMGYVDAAGNMVIPPQFEAAEGFSGGVARVMIQEQWRTINSRGEIPS